MGSVGIISVMLLVELQSVTSEVLTDAEILPKSKSGDKFINGPTFTTSPNRRAFPEVDLVGKTLHDKRLQ